MAMAAISPSMPPTADPTQEEEVLEIAAHTEAERNSVAVSGLDEGDGFDVETPEDQGNIARDKTKGGQVRDMPPWEQHGGVINMPRYLYEYLGNAQPGGGQKLTKVSCTGQVREGDEHKQYAKRPRTEGQGGAEDVEKKTPIAREERREPQPGPVLEQSLSIDTRNQHAVGQVAEEVVIAKPRNGHMIKTQDPLAQKETESRNCSEIEGQELRQSSQEFFLVKLARKGMVYISVSSRTSRDLVTFFERVLSDIHSGARPTPKWCHRIFPVQATCSWTKNDLRGVVMTLVKEFVKERHANSSSPLKYAVACNRRGVEEKDSVVDGSLKHSTFGKRECIEAVAEAVHNAVPNMVVDLTNPQMVVIVEVLPLVRMDFHVCSVGVTKRACDHKAQTISSSLGTPQKKKTSGLAPFHEVLLFQEHRADGQVTTGMHYEIFVVDASSSMTMEYDGRFHQSGSRGLSGIAISGTGSWTLGEDLHQKLYSRTLNHVPFVSSFW